MLIATNLLDLPAWIIALLYRYRWTIEIFFRFFKHTLGCRSLLSHDPEGIEIQTYCAIIACMLISLWTGRKPTLRTYEMICYYFTGLAEEDELLAHLAQTAIPRRLIERAAAFSAAAALDAARYGCSIIPHHFSQRTPRHPQFSKPADLHPNSPCATIEPNRIGISPIGDKMGRLWQIQTMPKKGISPMIHHSWLQKLDLSPFLPRPCLKRG